MDVLDGRLKIEVGDCLAVLKSMDENSVDCIVTSPPYWGLRDYGVEGQLGLEPTLDEHIEAMVLVFSELKRVLKPTGTCWLNYGDCYATQPNGRSASDTKLHGSDDRTFRDKPFSTVQGVFKPKDLCMVPNRLAIALQESGWWVRSEIIWAKPNPMPESVRDRPASAHEKIFLLTKSGRYDFNIEEVRQNLSASSVQRLSQDVANQVGSTRANGGAKTNGNMKAVQSNKKPRGHLREHTGLTSDWDHRTKHDQQSGGRNLRNYEPAPNNVWKFATAAFSDAHFATFPVELAERCILAGSSKGDIVLDPFGGAGTTALAALRHNRFSILVELNPEYSEMAKLRIEREWHAIPHDKRIVRSEANDNQPELFAA